MVQKLPLSCFTTALVAFLVIGALPARAHAQALPGARAAGMADAFVAVADDGSAVYWNPAGLVWGPYFSLQADLARADVNVDGADADRGGGRGSAGLVAMTVSPLGISYYRLRSTNVSAPRTAGQEPYGREREWRNLHTLTTHNVGVTVLQSVGEGLTLGVTGRLVVAKVGAAVADARGADMRARLDEASALETDGHVRGDIDAGAMVNVGPVRVGLVGRNLIEPEFDAGVGAPLTLGREARLGVAWGAGWPGPARVIVAADADLVRRQEASGERRDVAAGIETWWRRARFGVRGGARASTVGDARPIVTGGGSVGVTEVIFVDGYAAFGQEEARGWGLGARLVF